MVVEVVVRVVEEVVEAAEVCRWRQRQRQHAHRHAVLPHQAEHALEHDAEGHICAVAAARLAEEAHHVRLELERRRALLRRRESQHAPRRRRAVAGADRLDEADEGLTLVAREARDHAQVDERQDGRPSRRRVHQDVPRVEVGMHQVVDQQHLQVDVLAAEEGGGGGGECGGGGGVQAAAAAALTAPPRSARDPSAKHRRPPSRALFVRCTSRRARLARSSRSAPAHTRREASE